MNDFSSQTMQRIQNTAIRKQFTLGIPNLIKDRIRND